MRPVSGKQKPIFGLDLSSYQPENFDMAQARAEGYEFAVIKASEGPYPDGTTYDNPYYATQLQNAKDAGMVVGAYHYLVEAPAQAQVEHFISTIGEPKNMLLMVDYEAYGGHPELSPTEETLYEFIDALGRMSKKLWNGEHPILLYSGQGYWESPPPNGPVTDPQIITWDANYPYVNDPRSGPELYAEVWDWTGAWGQRWGDREPLFWQFSGSTPVAGVPQVDVNAFRGTRKELLALTGS